MNCSAQKKASKIRASTEAVTPLNCRSAPAERNTPTPVILGVRHRSGCCDIGPSRLALVSSAPVSSTTEVQPTPESDLYAMEHTPPDKPNAIHRLLRHHGGSSDGHLVGHWRVDECGRIVPRFKIRQHFDQLLLALGDATLEEIEAVLRAQAREELSESGVAQAMDLWRRYIVLRQLPTPLSLLSGDPSRRCCILDQMSITRITRLGTEWAKAFYGAEEAAMRTQTAQPTTRCNFATSITPDGSQVTATLTQH